MNLDSSWSSYCHVLCSIDDTDLIDDARACGETMSWAWRDIFFDVVNLPKVHSLVFTRPCQKVLLVISDCDCVNRVSVLVQCRHKQALWSNCRYRLHLWDLKIFQIFLSQAKALLIRCIEMCDEGGLSSLSCQWNIAIDAEPLRDTCLSIFRRLHVVHSVWLFDKWHFVESFEDLLSLRCVILMSFAFFIIVYIFTGIEAIVVVLESFN